MTDLKTLDNPKTLEEAAHNMREILIWIRAHPDKSILNALDYPIKGILFLLEEEAAELKLHMEQYH